ncbi:MAG: alanine racemase [Rickettsiales bacterium]|nr:alanine racemase [Rickettsiales bacterium]
MNGKENKIIISLDAIVHNYNVIKQKVGNIDIMPVLKADAYGSGSIEVAEVLINKCNCKNFFVFNIFEGVELRKKFKNKINNIFILSACLKNEENILIRNHLTPIIENFEQLERLTKYDIDFGLFFNTGMNRNGFSINDIDKIKRITQNIDKIKVIVSHMACGEEYGIVSQMQIENFNKTTQHFPNTKKSLFATNSIFTCTTNCDIVRPGIGLIDADITNNFKETITIKSYVKSIKNNKAIVPFGINNGLPEMYCKNGGCFVINNKEYKVKKIALNYSVLSVDNTVKINDEVVIADDNFSVKNIEDKSFYDSNNVLRKELGSRFMLSKKNKKYYKLDNILIKKRNSYKKYENTHIKNLQDRIETSILNIIRVGENGIVGYGATANVKKGDVLATVYGGYSDGISRYLSNTGWFYVADCKCKIIGRVSMDQVTILLDDKIKNTVQVGDITYLLKKDIEQILNKLKKEEIFYLLDKSKRVESIK